MGTIRVRAVEGSHALPGVRVSRLATAESEGHWFQPVGRTDRDGTVCLDVSSSELPVILHLEAAGYWEDTIPIETAVASFDIQMKPLPRGPLGWWHSCLGDSAGQAGSGAGVRIGLVDTGCGPTPFLTHVEPGGAWLEGNHVSGPEASQDVDVHGTHVAGLLAARGGKQQHGFSGIAPAATVVAVRVFSSSAAKAEHDDIANAIEDLVVNHRVDLINLSLGGPAAAEAEQEAIQMALDAGVAVFAAAGNDRGKVDFPAALEEVIAVTALGKLGEGGTLARSGTYLLPGSHAEPGDLYPAGLCSVGPEINCVAPGVDVISTVPVRHGERGLFAAMTGTSMSTPIACAALAVLLGRDEGYARMPRDRKRADYACRVLLDSCRRLGFEREREGAGLPSLP